MNRLSYRKGFILIVATIAFASVCVAQSGRRGTSKPTTTATETPVPVQKEVAAKPPEPPKRIQLLVVIDEPNPFGNPSAYLSRIVLDGCLQRLSEAHEVVAAPAGNAMSRGEALKHAKRQKEKYVVWLEIGNSATESGRSSRTDGDEFFVGYTIYEPETGKVKRAGRLHRNVNDPQNVGILGPSRRRGIYPDQAFKEAGQEVGDQILSAFGVRVPTRR